MNKNLKTTLRRILVPRIPQISLILVLLLISTGLEALSPWPFKILIDNVLGHELLDTSSLIGKILALFITEASAGTFVVVSYFAISLLSSLSNYFYSLWNNFVVQRITRSFAKECFDNLAKIDYSYFRKKDVGAYVYKLNADVTSPSDIIESSILPIVSSSLYLAVALYVLGSINLVMAGISLASLPLLSISLYYMNKKISNASTALENKNGTLYTYIEQVVSQIRIIQAYTQQHRVSKGYDKAMWTSLLAELNLFKYTIILTLVNGVIIGLTYTTVIGIGIQRVNMGLLSTGLLMVFVFYLDNIVTPVVDIIEALSTYKSSLARLKNTADIFDSSHHLQDTGTLTTIDKFSINFNNMGIKDDKGRSILSHITFNAEPGKLTAIVGRSGSGKSSIFQLILRLTDKLNAGEIKIGNHLIKDYSIQTLRTHIAYVPQETDLFDESIFEIINFGSESATLAQVKKSADMAQATEFIEKRPEKFDSKVGEGGNLLSGGERQRLLLARAYLRNANIFLLDEIFSAQDAETQGKMMENLREFTKNKTVLLITHTYSILQPSDHVIVIDNGKITAEGAYKDLEKKNKLPSLEMT